jgi:hypothetical protein
MGNLLSSYETLEYAPKMVLEAATANGGKMMLRGIIQKADTLNQNGRIYPHDILEREIRNYQKYIVENRALAELDHPDSSVINLKNVCHIMREARMEGNIVYGALEVLETPSGKILESLIKSGVKLGISSRGVGSTRKQGDYYVVEDDFVLICFDMVSEPSTTSAFMLPEGKKFDVSGKNLQLTRADRVNRVIGDIQSLIKK